jgi:arsenate reductase
LLRAVGGERHGIDEGALLRMNSPGKTYNVLFLCTGNSARSIVAESLLRHLGKGRFNAFSAGSHPKGEVHPMSLEVLRGSGLPTGAMRSKSWDEFARPGAPELDFVITVCDNAAGEVCPIWPGQPVSAHWGVEDPAAFEGTDEQKKREFSRVAGILRRRIELFTSLPIEKIDRLKIERSLKDIGKK